MNPDEDTEWNDILRQKGILPPKEPSAKELIEKAIDEVLEERELRKQSKYEDLDLEDLLELEELGIEEDERVLMAYKNKRMEEFKAQLSLEKFGSVYQISKPDFIKEVTEASKDNPVIVHLFKDSYLACRQLNKYLETLANKYKATKFVKIISDLCIENYPDRNLPTLIIYDEGTVKHQLTKMPTNLGGELSTKLPELEKLLRSHGVISDDPAAEKARKDSRKQDKMMEEENLKNPNQKSIRDGNRNTNNLSDDEEGDYSDY